MIVERPQRGGIQQLRVSVGLGCSGGGGLIKQIPNIPSERFVSGAVTRVVNVMFEIVKQLVGGRITLPQVARQGAMEDFIETVIDARVKRAEIGYRQIHHAMTRFLGAVTLENILVILSPLLKLTTFA